MHKRICNQNSILSCSELSYKRRSCCVVHVVPSFRGKILHVSLYRRSRFSATKQLLFSPNGCVFSQGSLNFPGSKRPTKATTLKAGSQKGEMSENCAIPKYLVSDTRIIIDGSDIIYLISFSWKWSITHWFKQTNASVPCFTLVGAYPKRWSLRIGA